MSLNRAAITILSVAVGFSTGCSNPHPEQPPPPLPSVPARDINAVLRDHDQALMANPGVVGVYVGLCADGKTLCLKVMVIQRTPDLERTIPKVIEGHPVELDVTGVIRPLDSP